MVTTLKAGPLAVWNRLKNNPPYSLALSALSSLFYSLNDNLYTSITGKTYLKGFNDNPALLAGVTTAITGITDSTRAGIIMDDVKYGLNTDIGVKTWVNSVTLFEIDDDDTNIVLRGTKGNGDW